MMTIKRLLEGLTKKTEKCIEKTLLDTAEKTTKAAYEMRIAELENALLQVHEELRAEREKSALELKKVQEEMKLAKDKIEELKGTIKKLQADKYGNSSEQSKYIAKSVENTDRKNEHDGTTNDTNFEEAVEDIKADRDEVGERRKKKKGGQNGHKGHGRRIPKNLRIDRFEWDLPEENCSCPICGKKYRLLEKLVRKSHEIDLQIELLLREHFQNVYERECNCDRNASELIVAKKPESIIYKSVYTTNTWCKLLAMKYLTGIPVNKFNELTNNMGYKFNPSTILGGFEKLLDVMNLLYKEILKYNQNESHWHADETRWCRMLDTEGKKRRLFWMWVFVGKLTVVYVLDPTRSQNVPEKHFKNTKEGILNVDRYASYNIVGDKLILAYCWYHLRRDYINVGKKYKSLMEWSLSWLIKIRDIERLNRKRFQNYSTGLPYEAIQDELCLLVNKFFKDAENEIELGGLNKEQTKVLKSMIARNNGYTVFIEYPWVPMSNNVAERQFRHISYARNSYGGSKSHWGGELAAVTWTIFKTAQLNGINPVDYIMNFFQKYVETNGFPDGISAELLPWNYKETVIVSNSSLNSG